MFSLRAGDIFDVDGRAALFFNDAAKLRQRRCGSRIIPSFFFNFFFGIGLYTLENAALTFFKKAVKMVIWSFVIFALIVAAVAVLQFSNSLTNSRKYPKNTSIFIYIFIYI